MPNDLRWFFGDEASPGKWMQIQIIVSLIAQRPKSIACRLIKILSVSDK